MDSARRLVKSIPWLHRLLRPAVEAVRHARRAPESRNWLRFRRFCSSLPALVEQPVFVKVGAHDGVTGDPCSDLLRAGDRWTGLLIEPVPVCFERLSEAFPEDQGYVLRRLAIGATAGTATLYAVDPAAGELPDTPSWFDQLGSFDRRHIERLLEGLPEHYIVEHEVEVRRLDDVLVEEGFEDVHLLQVDTEGHDLEVLRTVDFERRAPLAIYVEHRHLSIPEKREMLRLLTEHEYRVWDCGADFFALDSARAESLRLEARTRSPARDAR